MLARPEEIGGSEGLRVSEREAQERAMRAATVVDMEAHRLLAVVRELYCRGDLAEADVWGFVRDVELVRETLVRRREEFAASADARARRAPEP